MGEANQYRLLRERRFLPFFITQACGAFNDNLFKNALVILVTYQATRWSSVRPELLANAAAGLFILPFVLLSGLAGQLGERFDKSRILQWWCTPCIGCKDAARTFQNRGRRCWFAMMSASSML